MTNVIHVNFPKKVSTPFPRKRVFYLGQYYAGPPLCQSLENIWLKRKSNDRWVLQHKIQGRVYECGECHSDDLIDTLQGIPLVDEVSIYDLPQMGWRHTGQIEYFPSATGKNL